MPCDLHLCLQDGCDQRGAPVATKGRGRGDRATKGSRRHGKHPGHGFGRLERFGRNTTVTTDGEGAICRRCHRPAVGIVTVTGATYKRTRPRGMAPWSPRPATRALLDQVGEVLDTYADQLPLTLRQVFYVLVGRFGYDKSEKAAANLGEVLNRARRAGLVPFDAAQLADEVRLTLARFIDEEAITVAEIRSDAERDDLLATLDRLNPTTNNQGETP